MTTTQINYEIDANNAPELERQVKQFIAAQANLVPEVSYTSMRIDSTHYMHQAVFPNELAGKAFTSTAAFGDFAGYLKGIAKPDVKQIETVASTENEVLEVVKAYEQAWTSRDLVEARKHLADDLQFRGSIDSFDSADDFLGGLRNFVEGLYKSYESISMVVSGDTVHSLYRAKLVVGESVFAEVFRVKGGKIVDIRLVFDTAAFAALGAA